MNTRIRSLVARWTGGLLAVQFLLSGLCLMPQGAHAMAKAAPSPMAMSSDMAAHAHCAAMDAPQKASPASQPMHGCAHCDQPDAMPAAFVALDAPMLAPLALLAAPVAADAPAAAFLPAAWPDDAGHAGGAVLLYRTTQRLLI